MTSASGSRKCPHCAQWSRWQLQPTDRCEHCHEILDPGGLKAQQQQDSAGKLQKDQFNLTLIEIYATDSGFTRFWKRIVQAFQLSLMAIISFIIWFIALLAG